MLNAAADVRFDNTFVGAQRSGIWISCHPRWRRQPCWWPCAAAAPTRRCPLPRPISQPWLPRSGATLFLHPRASEKAPENAEKGLSHVDGTLMPHHVPATFACSRSYTVTEMFTSFKEHSAKY